MSELDGPGVPCDCGSVRWRWNSASECWQCLECGEKREDGE